MDSRRLIRGTINSQKDSPAIIKLPKGESARKENDSIAALPIIEIQCYCLFIIVMMIYVMYELYLESKANLFRLRQSNFENGWAIFYSKKDTSDAEWKHLVTHVLTPINLLGILSYLVIGHLLQRYFPQYRNIVLLVYSLCCFLAALALPILLLLLAHIMLMFILAQTCNVYIIWAGVIFQISVLNYDTLMSPIIQYFSDDDYYVMVIIVAMAIIRSMSFCLDFCQEQCTQSSQKYGFINYIIYIFYLPTFLTGPLMTYGQFYDQYNSRQQQKSHWYILPIIKEIMYYLFWYLFLETILHFLYFSALHNSISVLVSISPFALGACALCNLYFFQIKYMVIYGLARGFALFDGVDAPKPPNCIMAMYQYRDMWRYFDRGLHRILMKYIYFPCGGSRHGLSRQLLSALICFLYVCYWHGFNKDFCYWAFFNWCGIVLESIIIIATSQDRFTKFLNSWFSPAMQRRLNALCWCPLYLSLSLSNIIFLGGTGITYIYFERLILNDFPRNCGFIWFLFYMTIQLIMECHRKYGKTYLCEKKYRIP